MSNLTFSQNNRLLTSCLAKISKMGRIIKVVKIFRLVKIARMAKLSLANARRYRAKNQCKELRVIWQRSRMLINSKFKIRSCHRRASKIKQYRLRLPLSHRRSQFRKIMKKLRQKMSRIKSLLVKITKPTKKVRLNCSKQ